MEERRYELTSSGWNRIKRMLPPAPPPKSGKRGRPAKYDNRRIINGILWLAGSGTPWRELPERCGKWQTVSARFRLWKQRGIFEAIFAALSADADMEKSLSTPHPAKYIKVPTEEEKNRREKEARAIGMSIGCRNTKIHAIRDGLGNPLAFLFSTGNDHDSYIPCPCLVNQRAKGATSSAIRLTVREPSGSTLLLGREVTPSR